MKMWFFFVGVILLLMASCGQSNSYTSAEPVGIIRFDKALFRLVETYDSTLQQSIAREYPEILDVIGKAFLNVRPADSTYFDRLVNYYSEPNLHQLYSDGIRKFDSIPDLERQLGAGFAYFKDLAHIPRIYFHVSGLNQNILVDNDLLSLSIDKYMGSDYPLYQEYFYDFQTIRMVPERIVPDLLAGWLMSEFPFDGRENVLLDRMIYDGKVKYLLSKALPNQPLALFFGYDDVAMKWWKNHESTVWMVMVEQKHLYTPDRMQTLKYLDEHPAHFLSDEAPGNLGHWIGYRIVEAYMKRTKSTPQQLLENTDYQSILTESRYKP